MKYRFTRLATLTFISCCCFGFSGSTFFNDRIDRSGGTFGSAAGSLSAEERGDPDTSVKVENNLVSWGFSKSIGKRKVDTIIIHSTYNTLDPDSFSVIGVVEQFRRYRVASHYVIDRTGKIIRLVEEDDIAFHAGKSRVPDGRVNVNDFSIGIELINTVRSMPSDEQYNSLNKLLTDIQSRYKIKFIMGHSDIAPGRKTDPWNFSWEKIKREMGLQVYLK